jgi:hypothetical protein
MLNALFTQDAIWFGVPALVGTGLFIVRMVLMLVGADHSHDVPDTDVATDVDGHDAAGAFKALSLQTLMAFAMGFGWGGIFGLYTLNWELGRSMIVALGAGVLMVWLLAVLLKMVMDLQSSGNFKLDSVVGCEGDVYVGIPARGQGSGQVRLVISDRMRIINAQSEGDSVPTSSRIKVVRVNGDNTVTVAPV